MAIKELGYPTTELEHSLYQVLSRNGLKAERVLKQNGVLMVRLARHQALSIPEIFKAFNELKAASGMSDDEIEVYLG